MHKIENTPKVITIIGLVFEGIVGLSLLGFGALMRSVANLAEFEADLRAELATDISDPDQLDAIYDIVIMVFNSVFVIGIIVIVVFIINLVLFSKLIGGKFTEEQAKKVYLYQAIWGGFNLLFNQITGILYLISGIQGFNKRPDKIETREGI